MVTLSLEPRIETFNFPGANSAAATTKWNTTSELIAVTEEMASKIGCSQMQVDNASDGPLSQPRNSPRVPSVDE
jgi:hypothetical protein